MEKFIKKPVEIEAVQLTYDNMDDVLEWANSILPADKQIGILCYSNGDFKGITIPTKEGTMLCSFGDYVIKEPFPTDDRMFYPCKPDMFELTYDKTT